MMPFRAIEPIKSFATTENVARTPTRSVSSPPTKEDVSAPGTPPPESASAKRKHHVADRSGANWDPSGNYIVGKGRPPKNTQWKPGRSGNPNGPKPREKVDAQSELDDAILGKFTTIVNGVPTETTLGLFAINILKSVAANKNRLAAVDILNLYQAKLRERYPQQEGAKLLPEEQAIIDALLDSAGWDEMPAIRNRLAATAKTEMEDER